MLFDGAHQRLNLAGFGHQKRQGKCVVGLVTAFASEIPNRFISKAGRSDRRSNFTPPLRRSFSQSSREGGRAIFLKIKQGTRRGTADFDGLVIERSDNAVKSIFAAKVW